MEPALSAFDPPLSVCLIGLLSENSRPGFGVRGSTLHQGFEAAKYLNRVEDTTSVVPNPWPESLKAQQQNTQVAQNKPSQLPHGGGVGVGGSADLGVVATGASATGSIAGGVFYQPGKGVSAGGTATGGAVLYAGKHTLGAPKQDQGRTANLGAYAGAGPFAFVTNATTVNQLSGHFATTTLNVGVGPVKFSLQLSTGNGIWEFSVGPPIPVVSPGIGFSVSHITTETCTTGGAC